MDLKSRCLNYMTSQREREKKIRELIFFKTTDFFFLFHFFIYTLDIIYIMLARVFSRSARLTRPSLMRRGGGGGTPINEPGGYLFNEKVIYFLIYIQLYYYFLDHQTCNNIK